jgi:SNF2 family DNA or RNA helicase
MNDFHNSKFYPTFKKITEKGSMDEKKYQIDGISWAINNENGSLPYKVRGGIIADEMGLGKTFQIISVLTCNFKKRTLIVLPQILIEQWVSAFIHITGHRPLVYHSKFTRLSGLTFENINTSPIVITSYGMIASSKKRERNILHCIDWNRVIYDEAHHLKNKKTGIFKGASLINARIKWFITGTPIQNGIHDLYSLCLLLGIPASIFRDKTNHAFIRERFILKRTKKDVNIDVPPVQINHVLIPARDKISEFIHDELHSMLPFYIKEKTGDEITLSDDSNDEDDEDDTDETDYINEILITPGLQETTNQKDDVIHFPESKIFTKVFEGNNILPVYMRARQLCIYPPILKSIIKKNGGLVDNYRDLTIYKKTMRSTFKLDTLVKFILERKDNGNKKIIFCFFKDEIDYIHQQLNMINIKTDYIDGRVSNKKKSEILKDCPTVLLLQIQTSCEGLNLQTYSEVYFTSPHWNPAVESQAIGRCHRIGQTKTVEVFKFISISPIKSIEEYIIGVQRTKRELANLIIG